MTTSIHALITQAADELEEVHSEVDESVKVSDATPPSTQITQQIVTQLWDLLFPGFTPINQEPLPQPTLSLFQKFENLHSLLRTEIDRAFRLDESCTKTGEADTNPDAIAGLLLTQIPQIRRVLEADLDAAYAGDPAARGKHEIVLTYPGFHAVGMHRMAHALHKNNVPLLPRMMSEMAHREYGIDIHPGATIGERFFIDHGTGVVIGETTEIGRNVRVYQNVTLGASNLNDVEKVRGYKRHPTLKDDVIVYSGASLLGSRMIVNNGSVIGGNVTLINEEVPQNTMVYLDKEQLEFKRVPVNL